MCYLFPKKPERSRPIYFRGRDINGSITGFHIGWFVGWVRGDEGTEYVVQVVELKSGLTPVIYNKQTCRNNSNFIFYCA